MKMCCIAWLYEFVATLSASATPLLQKLEISHLHYPDAIISFVVLPLVYLMNDEDTKTIILEKNWYQGLRHMLGLYNVQE